MAQLDRLNYLPLLFWFLIFFLALYCLLFVALLPLIFASLKTRALFLNALLRVAMGSGLLGCSFALSLGEHAQASLVSLLFSAVYGLMALCLFSFRCRLASFLDAGSSTASELL